MRAVIASVLVCFSAVCAGATFKQVKRIADNDEVLKNSGISLSDVQFRLPCRAAIVETSDPPEFDGYLFVQSSQELNLYRLEGEYLVGELQLKLSAIKGVALRKFGEEHTLLKFEPVYQLQLFTDRRIIAVHLEHDRMVPTYTWLRDHGVPAHEGVAPIQKNVSTNPFRL